MEVIMKKGSALVPYIIAFVLCFYFLPLIMTNTAAAMFVMLILVPALIILTSLVHGIKHGFDIRLSVCALILFIPTLFIFYNISAWVYVPVYFGLSLLTDLLGGYIKKKN